MLEVNGSRPGNVHEKRKKCVRRLGNVKKKKRELS